ncbi:hypothetical protein ACFQ6Q_10630 [Streptomyces sp. NPDC056437]|uniref:hypothetical protein n=1 Tax=Streptomyces sp. NPDC056437 TaxID=3345816 RepID=UPI003698C820
MAQPTARTGSVTVARGHEERLENGTEVRLGVFLSISKVRRTGLTVDQHHQLAHLGLEWAAKEVKEGAA